jgi:hypothetical protein
MSMHLYCMCQILVFSAIHTIVTDIECNIRIDRLPLGRGTDQWKWYCLSRRYNVFRHNKILIDCVFGNSKFVVPSTEILWKNRRCQVFRINIKLLSNPVAELKIRENDSHCRSIVLKTMDRSIVKQLEKEKNSNFNKKIFKVQNFKILIQFQNFKKIHKFHKTSSHHVN